MPTLRRQIQKKAKMKRQRRWRVLPWALCDTSAAPVDELPREGGILLAFEGGRWVWPGIREGFERSVSLGGRDYVTLTTLTLDPLAFTIENFTSAAVAKSIIAAAKPNFKAAEVLAGEDADVEGARTCSEAWVRRASDSKIQAVADRAATLTRVPKDLQEDFRVLRYEKGQQFAAHTDYYDPEDFRDQPQIFNELQDGRNWLVTVFLYLNTVNSGGQTYFPSAYGKPLPAERGHCTGPSVSSKQGRALMYYSLHPDSTPNLSSMHGGCKVKKGVKYAVNIWTFNQHPAIGKADL